MQILRPTETAKLVGLCDRQLRDLEAKGAFPKRFRLHPEGRAVGHLEAEVKEWIATRAASREAV